MPGRIDTLRNLKAWILKGNARAHRNAPRPRSMDTEEQRHFASKRQGTSREEAKVEATCSVCVGSVCVGRVFRACERRWHFSSDSIHGAMGVLTKLQPTCVLVPKCFYVLHRRLLNVSWALFVAANVHCHPVFGNPPLVYSLSQKITDLLVNIPVIGDAVLDIHDIWRFASLPPLPPPPPPRRDLLTRRRVEIINV